MDDANKPMTAIVEFQVRSEVSTTEEWLAEWQLRAEDARVGEPETTAYAAAINAEAANQVLVFERYAQGAASLQKHLDRPAHAALTETMGAKNMTKRRVMGARFVDIPEFGWWSRPETATIQQAGERIMGG